MTAICGLIALAAVEMLTCPPPPDAGIPGYFSRYDEAPTIGTISYRQSVGDVPWDYLDGYAGLIAVADCGLIGREAWVMLAGQWRRVLIFDCAGHASTVEWMKADGILAELDYYLAGEIGFTHRGSVPGRIFIEDE